MGSGPVMSVSVPFLADPFFIPLNSQVSWNPYEGKLVLLVQPVQFEATPTDSSGTDH